MRQQVATPALLDSLKLLAVEQVILDGEIAVLDQKRRSSFQLLKIFKSSGGPSALPIGLL
jgi:ATP-dependent DNA ligase